MRLRYLRKNVSDWPRRSVVLLLWPFIQVPVSAQPPRSQITEALTEFGRDCNKERISGERRIHFLFFYFLNRSLSIGPFYC